MIASDLKGYGVIKKAEKRQQPHLAVNRVPDTDSNMLIELIHFLDLKTLKRKVD